MNKLGIVVLVIGTEMWRKAMFGVYQQPEIYKQVLINTEAVNNTFIYNRILLLKKIKPKRNPKSRQNVFYNETVCIVGHFMKV